MFTRFLGQSCCKVSSLSQELGTIYLKIIEIYELLMNRSSTRKRIANNIENGSIFGSNNTDACFVEKNKHTNLGKISKQQLAFYLAQKILSHFETFSIIVSFL